MSASRIARRRGGGHESHENNERWLLTYADMITLLLALFVVLFALSSINQRKFLAFRQGLTQTFNPSAVQTQGGSGLLEQTSIVSQPGSNPSPTPVIAGTSAPTPATSTEKVAAQIESALERAGYAKDASVTISAQGVEIEILADRVFFSTDSANFEPLGDAIVDTLAGAVKHDPNDLEIEGFTDNRPITGGPFSSNWALSAARAANVVNRMNVIDHIASSRLSAVGFGQTHPERPNTNAANQAKNRRVDVVVLNSQVAS